MDEYAIVIMSDIIEVFITRMSSNEVRKGIITMALDNQNPFLVGITVVRRTDLMPRFTWKKKEYFEHKFESVYHKRAKIYKLRRDDLINRGRRLRRAL